MKKADNFAQFRHAFYCPLDYEDDLKCLFNKKFQFRCNNEWVLPDKEFWFATPPWKVKELESLKSKLNFHKSQLNDFNIEEWSCHTRRRNPAGEVGWKIRCLINPEFLTQAWTKFYECAVTYNVIPMEAVTEGEMVSLHLCEAPGAFITSLNHYLKLNHPFIKWKWIASTLNPYYEGNSLSNMISDDRFMFHTLDSWHFGVDNTGNLMDWNNSQAIVKSATSLGKVMLVTADGSIDCLEEPDAQEEITAPLHYCEVITALQALSPGGTLIYKIFTMFDHSTVNLLYLLNNLFKEVNIYKPVTSRQGNSEVYAVCLKYKGKSILEPFVPLFKAAYGTELFKNLTMFPLTNIPDDFIRQIQECASYFCSIQCQVINSNLQAFFVKENDMQREIKKIRNVVATEFIWYYGLKPLDYEHEILKGALHEENKVNTNPRYHRGSYTERQMYGKMCLKEKCRYLNSFFQKEIVTDLTKFINDPVIWFSKDRKQDFYLTFTYGRPVQKINSSKFIFVPILKLFQQILSEVEFQDIMFQDAFKNNKNIIDIDFEVDKKLVLPELDYKVAYNVQEKRCFKLLLESVKHLPEDHSILIENYSYLTHFNVSILYILTNCFEKIGFTSNGSIILKKLLNKTNLEYLDVVEMECKIKRNDVDVLNCLPVQITNSGTFFDNIVFYNNTFYRNKCKEYLSIIEQSP